MCFAPNRSRAFAPYPVKSFSNLKNCIFFFRRFLWLSWCLHDLCLYLNVVSELQTDDLIYWLYIIMTIEAIWDLSPIFRYCWKYDVASDWFIWFMKLYLCYLEAPRHMFKLKICIELLHEEYRTIHFHDNCINRLENIINSWWYITTFYGCYIFLAQPQETLQIWFSLYIFVNIF